MLFLWVAIGPASAGRLRDDVGAFEVEAKGTLAEGKEGSSLPLNSFRRRSALVASLTTCTRTSFLARSGEAEATRLRELAALSG